MLFRPGPLVLSRYFRMALSEKSSLQRLLQLHKGIGAKHVNVRDMRNASIPLPPLSQQQQLLDRIDALLTLCDRLEAQLNAHQANNSLLLEAVLRNGLVSASLQSVRNENHEAAAQL
jgi:type I restriction enzyme S subunit